MQLYYKQLGETGIPVIILHGLFGSSDNWQGIAKTLSDQYRVYLIDQRNHGRSPHSSDFTYQAMSSDLLEFIKEHNIVKPVIIGHSMGGKTAMKFAVQYPEMLSKLVVIDISPRFYPVHHSRILEGLAAVNLQKITSRQEADAQLAHYEPHPTVRMFLLKNLYRNENGQFAWRINLPVINDQIENVGEALNEVSIDTPVLFINGEKSDYIKVEDHALIKKIFPKASFSTIPDAGHWVHAEKPEEFVSKIKDFVSNQ